MYAASEAGLANPRPQLRLLCERSPLVLVDGDHGLGPRVGIFATQQAQALAQKHGVGVVGVQRSTHFGAAGFYAEALAKEGLIGMVLTNVEPDVVPFGESGQPWAPIPWPLPAQPLRASSWWTWPLPRRPWARFSWPEAGESASPPTGEWTRRGTPPRTPCKSKPSSP